MKQTAQKSPGESPQLLPRAVIWAGATIALLWLAHATALVVLVFFFAIVLSITLSAPVTWLEDKGMNRVIGTLLVAAVVLALIGVLFWLVVPHVSKQTAALVRDIPDYAERLRDRAENLLSDHPAVQRELPLSAEQAATLLPSVSTLLNRVSSFSISILAGIALFLVCLGVVVYAVLSPRPLLELYLRAFPLRLRAPAMRAFSRASTMVLGWMWANIVVGSIEAVAVGVFLGIMGVPGAMVWAALAFFAELVPKIGLYLMSIPPVLVALATEPMTALWVGVFYLAMNEVIGDFVTPRIRASTMDVHPVSILFVMLIMAAAFGLVGALIATPIAAFVKAYYEEFYLARQPVDTAIDEQVNAMLHRRETARGGANDSG
ncbi:MAG: AI-2E family transporter [Candidatus Tectimicrobiota bacterium]